MLLKIQNYFSSKFPTHIRHLHYTVIFLVLAQILLSNGMHLTKQGVIQDTVIAQTTTWAHIIGGCTFFIVIILFTAIELKTHGFQYFFPYLWGKFDQIKEDVARLRSMQLPEAKPQGIAACVQGLGLGAGLLVVFSGLTWFVLWLNDSAYAYDVRELHKTLTGLIEAYIIGHGALGLLHIVRS
ncbi:cytochrome b/b6 domain-containing protein [Photobacterium nomapromontoriensis]|uniref:cytochrome b/b6 domain-containing protein n=1 Tax=Photobacterium nomapromontoriensis TaxID=2910237 RepID=UPI003D139DB8